MFSFNWLLIIWRGGVRLRLDFQSLGCGRISDVDGPGGAGGLENWTIFMDVLWVSSLTHSCVNLALSDTKRCRVVGEKNNFFHLQRFLLWNAIKYRMSSRIEIKTSMLNGILVSLLHLNYSWSIEFNDFRIEELNLIFSVYFNTMAWSFLVIQPRAKSRHVYNQQISTWDFEWFYRM